MGARVIDNDPCVVIGLGQMGGVFAHGLLRAGRTIVPVTRDTDVAALAGRLADPALVLLAVGEEELPAVLAGLPAAWRGRVGLLSNELVPSDWEEAGITDPTVAIVWFEKKRDTGARAILPTRLAGPQAELLSIALDGLGIPSIRITQEELRFELALKTLYILTSNLAGLAVGGTVGALFTEHRELAERVAGEVLAIEAWRIGQVLPASRLLEGLAAAFAADPEHAARGRSAPARLARALERARAAGLSVPTLAALPR